MTTIDRDGRDALCPAQPGREHLAPCPGKTLGWVVRARLRCGCD
jgi:hypothetical protein